jgi:hypothetical protein
MHPDQYEEGNSARLGHSAEPAVVHDPDIRGVEVVALREIEDGASDWKRDVSEPEIDASTRSGPKIDSVLRFRRQWLGSAGG